MGRKGKPTEVSVHELLALGLGLHNSIEYPILYPNLSARKPIKHDQCETSRVVAVEYR